MLIVKLYFEQPAHLLLHTVSSVHVFDVIEEVTDRVHVAEMLAVLIHGLQHLVEGHTNLKRANKQIYKSSANKLSF